MIEGEMIVQPSVSTQLIHGFAARATVLCAKKMPIVSYIKVMLH